MSKQTQTAETQVDKKNKSHLEPALGSELADNLIDSAQWSNNLLAAAGVDSVETQAARLHDSRLLTAQRRALAGQIGRVHGNRHLQRLIMKTSRQEKPGGIIQRVSPDAAAGAAPPKHAPSKELDEKEQEKKQEFLGQPFVATNYVPSTGKGKFDAQYYPASDHLIITVKIHFDFLKGTPPEKAPEAVIKSYSWTKEEEDEFKNHFIELVMIRWSGKFTMHCTKPGWEDIIALPLIMVFATDATEAHFHASVTKVGEGLTGQNYRSGVDSSEHKHDGENGQESDRPGTADLHSPDNQDKQNFMSQEILDAQKSQIWSALAGNGVTWIPFSKGKATIPANKQQSLQKAAQQMPQFPPGAPALPIVIAGGVAEGEAAGLVQQRAEAVQAILAGAGVANLMTAPSQESQAGVTISLGELPDWQNKQNTSEHEFGHMLGNPDEYARPGNNTEAWEKLVESAKVRVPTMREWTTSQMSAGSDVLAAHYVTIWEALGLMTTGYVEQSEWKIGK